MLVEQTTPANAQSLPPDVEALRAILQERERLIASQSERIAFLEHHVEVLRKLCFGPSSEKRRASPEPPDGADQRWLFVAELAEEAQRTAAEKEASVTLELRDAKPTRKARGRRQKFPDHLPRVRSTYELPEEQRRCACGASLSEIGEEVTRELERLEVAVVHEIARKKYACRQCEGNVRIAPRPERAIEKGILGTGFLAHVIVERFGQHLPYHRLEKKYAAERFDLSRVVLWKSMERCARRLTPIYDQLKAEVLASPVIHTDDTPVTVAESTLGGRRQGNFWIYLDREGRHWYDFTESRKRDGPLKVLGDYRGYIQADRYKGYEPLYLPGGATEVACWAHARRRYVKAESTNRSFASEAIARIRQLYDVEDAAKKAPLEGEALASYRREHAGPVLEELRAWLAQAQTQVLEKSPMAEAIRYTLGNWNALTRYLEDGRLSIDNNPAERALRPWAVGRSNWMFVGNPNGGRTGAILMSLLMSAKASAIVPRQYFRDVLLRVGKHAHARDLTPLGWKQRFEPELKTERQRFLDRLLGRG